MSITFTAATITQDGYSELTSRPDVPQVNMSNGNAADLFTLLGLEYDGDGGETSAQDFLGRVLLAQALLDVTTDDAHGQPEIRDGNWTTCGRRPGYMAERLIQMQAIATWAINNNAIVAWT